MENEYVPFGTEWEKEMCKFTKIELIRKVKFYLQECEKLQERLNDISMEARERDTLRD